MTEYPEDYPTLSAGPPPVTYSDRVYDYPADPPPRPPWLTPVSIIGTCIAVIALVAAATAILVRSTVPHDFPAPPTVTSTSTSVSTAVSTSVSTVTLPPPPPPAPPHTTTVVIPAPRAPQPSTSPSQPAACLWLRSQADADYSPTVTQAKGHWVPQLSSKRPGLVAEGTTWDCDSILAEHQQLRATYQADLLWSGDWPNTYHNDNYWVTVAAYIFNTADEARQWCQDHGRDVPEHCYPTEIR